MKIHKVKCVKFVQISANSHSEWTVLAVNFCVNLW